MSVVTAHEDYALAIFTQYIYNGSFWHKPIYSNNTAKLATELKTPSVDCAHHTYSLANFLKFFSYITVQRSALLFVIVRCYSYCYICV